MFLGTLVLGCVVGLISSILGLGGGILIVPLLPLFTDLSRKESVFVSLAAILIIVTINTISFLRQGQVNLKAVFMFGPLTAVGSAVAAFFISPYFSNNDLRITLATVLLVWGLMNIFKVFKKTNNSALEETSLKKSKLVFYCLLSLLAGVLSGLLGIGSGLILSLMLVGIFWVDDDKISPTSNGIMVFTTFFACLAYVIKNQAVDVLPHIQTYTFPLVLGAVSTSFFGRKIQHLLSRKARGVILILLLIVLSMKTFMS